MITIDKVDLKFIFFTTAMRILELTRLFTARVIYEKKNDEENKKLSNTLKIRVFPVFCDFYNFKCSMRVRQRIFLCLVGLRRNRDT